MADYKTMYYQLFAAQAEAIELLQKAHQRTEELYINSLDPAIIRLDTAISSEDSQKAPKN